ncbi:uncharacterized protein LOC127730965 [Mytilus californianus]|uniref:uncharacterized protein LOC127730965 n=1 Tax=Mytilus californianus TaxID=6549 RepID=UPI002246CA0D|nr:uncharacterized protein LOC127730965 [Mytilus californianus]
MIWWLKILICTCIHSILFSLITGLECECTTYECLSERRRICTASHSCYSQMTNDIVERGCIDRKTPLLCENQRPNKKKIAKLMAGWPVLHCCRDKDFCNKGVIPTEPPRSKDLPVLPSQEDTNDYLDENQIETITVKTNCPQSVLNSGNGSSGMINPIYIAVPVAGLCVLLALIIFAMYLLRRRGDYYERYPYPPVVTIPRHHVSCKDSKCAPSCKLNRCTDSERSSSGSETKLFL